MAYLPPDRHAQLAAVAEAKGQTVSAFLGQLIDIVLGEEEGPAESQRPSSRSRREGKVTVRLASDARDSLSEEAERAGLTPSTWAANLLTARLRTAPQPTARDRRRFMAGLRQIHGLSTNVNQIAYAMNRGVFTGDSYAPARNELAQLRREVAELRQQVRDFARGRLAFQLGLEEEELTD
ncbi:plasmid mobilization relaxosome protein MobC (plasmid) [Leisingera sp. M527]|uniref:plasmid mobilization relaxosome protein MobC n=1 Tax=Leisingera sp. M527 TaxID=2867014 RepID=UPI0021A7DF58|nr:plasmid mobilization relaxosome protein MobC [Leisingera sp. M527]UWQ35392.1 plasmid mobilization relaxosome protein MobC [Leisingera sp. M527]